MADINDDDPIEKGRGSKWVWFGVIVLLGVAAVMFFLNADGDEELDQIPDSAITTTEERLNTDLGDEAERTDEALEDVRGVNQIDTVTPDETSPAQAETPEPEPAE